MTEKGLKYLADIIHAIELIEEFTSTISLYSDYEKDLKTQSAVERQLGIIGEAVNKFDLLHPEVSLKNARKIVGFRNRIIHSYDAVDSSMIWAIISRHLKPLYQEVKGLMEKRPVANSTYPQAGVSCFVGQESSKFEVKCFVGNSVVKIPACG